MDSTAEKTMNEKFWRLETFHLMNLSAVCVGGESARTTGEHGGERWQKRVLAVYPGGVASQAAHGR